MIVIAAINSKGGCGKSVLVRSLAVLVAQKARADQGQTPVCILDLDPQLTVDRWWARRGSPENPRLLRGEDSAAEGIEAINQGPLPCDVLFVDTPPASLDEMEAVCAVADLVLVPILPDLDNAEASREALIAARRAAKERGGSPRVLAVVNRAKATSPRGTQFRDHLRRSGLIVAEQIIHDRDVHSQASDLGRTGPEQPGDAGKAAAAEIEALWGEIQQALGIAQAKRGGKHARR